MREFFAALTPVGATADEARVLRQAIAGLMWAKQFYHYDVERGRRPVFGDVDLFQTHPDWHNLLPFHEYFHGDTGRGVGASHQTGWTALVADLVMRTAGRGATGNRPD